ncbi:MAG: carboxymuconolactone decarboxylase family protein [Parvularculaceae bacterium]
MSHFSFLKTADSMGDILLSDMDKFQPYLEFAAQVMRGPSELSEKERELMVAYVAGLNACDFCFGAHKATAEAFGADASVLEALLAGDDSILEEKLRPVFTLVRKLTKEPSKVVKADIDAIVAAGWKEKTAQDAICVTAFMNCSNRIVSGHGVEGSPAAFDLAARVMGPGGGYSTSGAQAGLRHDL